MNPKRVLEADCLTDLPQTSSGNCLDPAGQAAAPTVAVLAAALTGALATAVGRASEELRWLFGP